MDKAPDTGRNQTVDLEGIKVRTTARKLLTALWDASLIDPLDACFLGQVEYMAQDIAAQHVANEVGRVQLKAFAGGIGHARSLLIKRAPLITSAKCNSIVFVEPRDDHDNSLLLPIEINPDTLFEEVVLDPRLQADDAKARETEIRSFGYNGPITKSELYRSAPYNIVLR